MKFTTEMDNRFKELAAQGWTMEQIVGGLNDEFAAGVTLSILKHHKRALRFAGKWEGTTEDLSGHTTHETTITLKDGEDLTPEMVLEKHGYDAAQWEIVNHTSNAWQQRPGETVYQSKLTVKPIASNTDLEALVEALNQDVEPIRVEHEDQKARTNLVIPLADMHFGHTTYDDLAVKIQNLRNAIARGYETIAIVVVGDLLHSDVVHGTRTTRGTVLEDVDMRRGLSDADKFMGQVINLSLEHANRVVVYSIAGNHDRNLGYLYMRGLAYKFPQVEFNNTADNRLAFQLGRCGFMVLHGDVALKRAPMLFANEYADLWASTSNRTIFSGHFHTQKTVDEGGVMLRQLGTPKPNDKYERDNGFTMGNETFQVFEYDLSRLVSTIEV